MPILLSACLSVSAVDWPFADESLWPSIGGKPTQLNFSHPLAPVHITAGNGGAPGPDCFSRLVNKTILVNGTILPASRRRNDGGNATVNGYQRVANSAGYLRMRLANASTSVVEYVLASDSSVFDRFVVSASKHGPFSMDDDGEKLERRAAGTNGVED